MDDENTMEEQEQNESRDYKEELDELKNEGICYLPLSVSCIVVVTPYYILPELIL